MNFRTIPPYMLFAGFGILAFVGIVSVLSPSTSMPTDAVVVASSTPVTLLVQPLLKDLPDPAQLIPPGQELHDFQPAPSAIGLTQGATLVIGIGGADETWLPELLTTIDPVPATLFLTSTLQRQGQSLLEEEEHGEIGVDPHVWLSPKLVLTVLPAVADALIAAHPTKRLTIERNADQFTTQLQQLDSDITSTLAAVPQHRFISFHNAFSYFARDYGLEQVAVIEEVPGEAPTPGDIAAIQDAIRTYKLRGLFVEPQFSSALVEQLSSDQQITVETLDPLETAATTDTYIGMMRQNLAALVRVLGASQ